MDNENCSKKYGGYELGPLPPGLGRLNMSSSDNKSSFDVLDENIKFKKALGDLYDAGYWTCDRDVDEEALWIAARDALGRDPGKSPKPLEQK